MAGARRTNRGAANDGGEILGLTAEQVAARLARGQVNQTAQATSRSYGAILRSNLLTLFNGILAATVLLLLAVGQYRDALLIGGLVAFTVVVSIVQEIRAKLRLDKIALLARARVRVLRDGREQSIDPSQVVLGDYLLLAPGEQIVADGTLAKAQYLEVDESLLTGESDAVSKAEGDTVLSGSFGVAGSGVYVATRVGRTSYVHTITSAARRYRSVRTPLQRFLNRVLRVLLSAVVALSLLQVAAFLVKGMPLVDAVRATAVIATLVPQGLLLMSTVAYSLGAVRIARYGGLVQQINAVESLSHVHVLCTDKTGTLTRNRLVLREVVSLGDASGDAADAERLVATYAASSPEPNSTLRAIAERLPATQAEVSAVVPFQSRRKWSGLALAENGRTAAYVLGAPEVLLPGIVPGTIGADSLAEIVAERTEVGQRVLLFAEAPSAEALRSSDGAVSLPSGLRPLALVVLEEELRPDARATLEAFAAQGIQIKLISGDNPRTVLALARRAGLPASATAMAGSELTDLPPKEFAAAVERTTVFGRTTPQHKQQIIRALKRSGEYVAMVGDGANDILAMKEAHLAVAMESGSPAARAAADIILLGDTFAVLPRTLEEGRRIISSMQLLIKLFVVRDVATIGLIGVSNFVGAPFPLLPAHTSVVAFLTVGLPSVFVVAWAKPERLARNLAAQVARFVLQVGAVGAVAISSAYILTLLGFDADAPDLLEARTVVVTAALVAGLVSLVYLTCPLAAPVKELASNRPVLYLAILGFVAYIALLGLPAARGYLELTLLSPLDWVVILVINGVCFVGLRVAARYRAIEKLLG